MVLNDLDQKLRTQETRLKLWYGSNQIYTELDNIELSHQNKGEPFYAMKKKKKMVLNGKVHMGLSCISKWEQLQKFGARKNQKVELHDPFDHID